MSNARSVIVCSGGIVGLSTACYLACEGFDVGIVERNAEGAESCAHGGQSISPSRHPGLRAGHGVAGIEWMLIRAAPFISSRDSIRT